ncbi:hypothetical protein [Streptomyces sp. MA5143a]|uniref:hypothetical protein n=1 Tax=Streptomyces sp. MA5143a TaxID=2083010 RepID=UPI002159983B|nr:hypothetical protein [Streptomyces sp. MA5143a]
MAEGLRACGWTVHRIGDVFPHDGQDIPDEEWITHGLDRCWVPPGGREGRSGGLRRAARPHRTHLAVRGRRRKADHMCDGRGARSPSRTHAGQGPLSRGSSRRYRRLEAPGPCSALATPRTHTLPA